MDHDYIARHQVIDEYVKGRLPEAEAARFEDHYLNCQECIRNLDLAERFQRGFRDVAAEELAAPVGWAAVFATLARRRRAAAAGVFVLAVIVAAGLLAMRTLRLDRELTEVRERLAGSESSQSDIEKRAAAAERETAALQERLAAERQSQGRLTEELSRERRPRASAAWVVALVPARSGPAAGEPFQTIAPPPAGWVVLTLDLDLPGPGPYRVKLRRRDGAVVWEGKDLRPGPTGTLAVGLDPSLLPPGDYRLAVEEGAAVPVARFAFRVTASSSRSGTSGN